MAGTGKGTSGIRFLNSLLQLGGEKNIFCSPAVLSSEQTGNGGLDERGTEAERASQCPPLPGPEASRGVITDAPIAPRPPRHRLANPRGLAPRPGLAHSSRRMVALRSHSGELPPPGEGIVANSLPRPPTAALRTLSGMCSMPTHEERISGRTQGANATHESRRPRRLLPSRSRRRGWDANAVSSGQRPEVRGRLTANGACAAEGQSAERTVPRAVPGTGESGITTAASPAARGEGAPGRPSSTRLPWSSCPVPPERRF